MKIYLIWKRVNLQDISLLKNKTLIMAIFLTLNGVVNTAEFVKALKADGKLGSKFAKVTNLSLLLHYFIITKKVDTWWFSCVYL